MPKVGLFISWSGNSRGFAELLYEWLPTALHSVEPWMSDHDISKGSRFLEEIDRALVQCKAGLVCVTPENCQSVWVAFEAGALASRVSSSKLVIPLIMRMRHADVPGPLSMFQASTLTKVDMLKLVLNLNELNDDDDKIPEKRLTATFLGVWPELERRLPELEEATTSTPVDESPTKKTDTQLLEEILDVTKSVRILVADRLRNVISDSPGPPAQEQHSYSPIGSGAALEGREGYLALTEPLLRASEIWLAGVSLLTVLDQYFDVFSEYVERDRLKLRFLLLDPDDTILLETATRALYGVTTHDDLRQDIMNAVTRIASLESVAQERKSVQLRYLSNLPSTSIIMADPMSGNGFAIAEFYPYRASMTDRPHIVLNELDPTERKWFLFYRQQFLTMWRDARTESDDVE